MRIAPDPGGGGGEDDDPGGRVGDPGDRPPSERRDTPDPDPGDSGPSGGGASGGSGTVEPTPGRGSGESGRVGDPEDRPPDERRDTPDPDEPEEPESVTERVTGAVTDIADGVRSVDVSDVPGAGAQIGAEGVRDRAEAIVDSVTPEEESVAQAIGGQEIGADDIRAGVGDVAETVTPDGDTEPVRDQLQAGSAAFQERVAEPAGDVAAATSPARVTDAAVEGEPGQDAVRDFTTAAVGAADVPALADLSIATGERVVTDAQRTAEGDGAEVVGDAADDVTAAGVGAVEAVRGDPLGATATGAGALAGGVAVGTGAVRGAQRARSGLGSSAIDLDDFAADRRAQAGPGRQRRDTDQEQEAIQIERMADEQQTQRTGPAELEDIPGVTVQRSRQQQRQDERSLDELEADIREGLDELGIEPAATQRGRTQPATATPPAGQTATEAVAGFGLGAGAVGVGAPGQPPGAAEAEGVDFERAIEPTGVLADPGEPGFDQPTEPGLDEPTATTGVGAPAFAEDERLGVETGTQQVAGVEATQTAAQDLDIGPVTAQDTAERQELRTAGTTDATTTGITAEVTTTGTPDPPIVPEPSDDAGGREIGTLDVDVEDALIEQPTRSLDVVDEDIADIGSDFEF